MSPSHRSGSVGIPGPIVEFALPERVLRHPQVSGQDLEWFFHQWLHLPGYPVFEVENEWIPDECGSGGTVEVTVRQVQKADWPRFGMPESTSRRWRCPARIVCSGSAWHTGPTG